MPEETLIPKTKTKISFRSKGVGLLVTLNIFLFIAVLLVSVGLFFYRGLLESQVQELKGILGRVEGEFEPSLILELRRTARSIDSAKQLLTQHTAPSRFFEFLKNNTLPDTRFSGVSYQEGMVVMSGTTRSYTTLAQQSLAFEQHSMVQNVTFSNFSLGAGGFVSFVVELSLNPALTAYQAE